MSQNFQLEDQYCFNFYQKRGPVITHGKGSWIYDEEAKKYLDMSGQIGIVPLGHANPELLAALNNQASQIAMTMMSLNSPARAHLARKLSEIFGQETRTYFANSGTEAMEAALKFARVITGRTEFISANKSFHGRTYGALSIMGQAKYADPFLPGLPGCHKVSLNKIDEIKEKLNANTAAIILEPIQGEGGLSSCDLDYLREISELCTKNATLLILDEVQTGVGRTGKFFCFEYYDIKPDIVCIAKLLSGGLVPIGACIVKKEFSELLQIGHHGSTYGSNPLACAVALKTIEIIERDDLLNYVIKMGDYFRKKVMEFNSLKVRDLRGRGLMLGVGLKKKDGPEIINELLKKGVIGLNAGPTVLRFLPPLNISKEDMDFFLEALKAVL